MKKGIFISAVFYLFTSPLFGQRISAAIDSSWKFTDYNLPEFSQPQFNDSSWESIALPTDLSLAKGGAFFWLRARITIPQELRNQKIWFDSGKTGAAFDLYINGQYLGSRGRLPPDYHLRQQSNEIFFIPESALQSGELVIALHCYFSSVTVDLSGFSLINQKEADWLGGVQVFFNMRMYVILAAICLFLGIYFFVQYAGNNEDSASLWYALSLLLIAIYFFDMGSEVVLADLLQIAVARSAMNASLGFILLFFMKFFGTRGYAIMKRVVPVSYTLLTIAYILNYRNNVAIDTIFNLSLLPVFSIIIFALLTVIKAARRRNPDAWPILGGLIIGLGFGVHDILYQVSGQQPFAWLQGITFFMLNLSVFVAMSARAARAQRDNIRFGKDMTEQHEKMRCMVTSVQTLMHETSGVSETLDTTVKDISDEVRLSNNTAAEISNMIQQQRQGLESASKAIEQLLRSIHTVNNELETEAVSIEASANDTASLIKGFSAVSTMLRETAVFTDTLEKVTNRGNTDMVVLSRTMDTVRDLSGQIRSVVDALNDFAERTNLLAMNASIEAAHAGSSGRGFAVIAQEIKKLAAASSERAGKITELVQSIDAAVKNTVQTSAAVRQSLQEIAAGADETAKRIREASAHTEQQQRSGAAIAAEAANLSASAQKMIGEVGTQKSFSGEVRDSMTALSGISVRTETAADAIMARNSRLEEQAAQVRQATKRSQAVVAELQRLLGL